MNPYLALIIANIIWGGASPIFKFALENIPPFTLAFIRFLFASLLFIPIVFNHWQKIDKRSWLEIFLVGFFGIFINISFFFLGLKKTESINAPIIASSAPIFIYLFSIIFLKEKPKLKVLLGIFISLIGVLIIIFSPFFFKDHQLNFGRFEGNFFIFLATLGYVGSTIISRNLLQKVNPYLLTFFSFFFSSLLFLILVPKELKNWNFNQLNINGWLGIIYGVFFSSAAAYFLFYYGVSKIKAQEVGLFTYIDPVITVIIAIPLLGEYPNLFYFLGTIFVFGGIYLAEKRFHYHPLNKISSHSNKNFSK